MALFPQRKPSKIGPQRTQPQKPKGLFEEKREWHRLELTRRMKKASPYIPGTGGRMYSLSERSKMIEEIFPRRRFGNYISEQKAKLRLRELRREEYRAKTSAERLKISRQRRYLENVFGLKGKY